MSTTFTNVRHVVKDRGRKSTVRARDGEALVASRHDQTMKGTLEQAGEKVKDALKD